MRLSFDSEERDKRYGALENYFQKSVLNRKRFICSHYRECRSSFSGDFFKGQLHHVGRYYDLSVDSMPFRIVVVGKEYGYDFQHFSLQKRYEQLMTDTRTGLFEKPWYRRKLNPHMKGTTSLLRLLFGIPLGFDINDEFVTVGDSSFHVYDGFALVNYFLCSAVIPGTPTSRPTREMRENCFGHFRKALSLLEPTVIAVQGKTIWDPVKKAFDLVEPVSDALFRATLNGQESFLCLFSHPSARKDLRWVANEPTPYLLETVVPAVERILGSFGDGDVGSKLKR